jgi:hypothetical protein
MLVHVIFSMDKQLFDAGLLLCYTQWYQQLIKLCTKLIPDPLMEGWVWESVQKRVFEVGRVNKHVFLLILPFQAHFPRIVKYGFSKTNRISQNVVFFFHLSSLLVGEESLISPCLEVLFRGEEGNLPTLPLNYTVLMQGEAFRSKRKASLAIFWWIFRWFMLKNVIFL